MFDIESRNVDDIISCPVFYPKGWNFIKEILRESIFIYLKKIVKFSKPPPLFLGFHT